MTDQPIAVYGVFQLHDNLPEDEVLLSGRLQEHGYQTALIGKLHVSGRMTEAEKRHPTAFFCVSAGEPAKAVRAFASRRNDRSLIIGSGSLLNMVERGLSFLFPHSNAQSEIG